MPSLSLNVGLNNGRKLPFGGGAAPSGIPVASTASVVISGNATFNGTALKKTVGQRVAGDNFEEILLSSGTAYAYNIGFKQGSILLAPNSTLDRGIEGLSFSIPSNTWFLVNVDFDTESGAWNNSNVSENPSTDPTTIPTTGWSPSITITAA